MHIIIHYLLLIEFAQKQTKAGKSFFTHKPLKSQLLLRPWFPPLLSFHVSITASAYIVCVGLFRPEPNMWSSSNLSPTSTAVTYYKTNHGR